MGVRKILVIDAHPDPAPRHFVHALAQAYADGAESHETRLLKLAELDFPILRSPEEWTHGGPPPEAIAAAQADILWADHLVFLYPLWLGEMPALLKAFLEQAMRPGFAFKYAHRGFATKLLEGRSARIVVTMGMPRLWYSAIYRAHSLKTLRRNILHFVGIGPVACTIIGSVEGSENRRRKWLRTMKIMGAAGR